MVLFFFSSRRRHTRFKCDWSSDVCSSDLTLTVNAAAVAPTITTQPVNQTVTAGQTATFGVAAGGAAPRAYQWQKNGGDISGATLARYTTPGTATTGSGTAVGRGVGHKSGGATGEGAEAES